MIVHLPPYRVEAVAQALPSSGLDWSISAYGLPALWSRHQGAGVRVGVLDTGVDDSHPALQGVVKEHRNFTRDCSASDTNGHGTHVAGIIAARGPMTGVAPRVEIISCKVLNNNGSGSLEAVGKAIAYAVEAGCNILVMSLGAPIRTPYIAEAVQAANDAGVIMVCAAGNDGGKVSYPAAFDQTIAVGAVGRHGGVCEFSCRGREIDVAAPGEEITSCWLGGGYATLSGTSMAAPFVAGVLALAWPQMPTPRDGSKARAVLKNTSVDAGDPGHDHLYGWGLISPSSILEESSKVLV
jgi:subtilisin